MDSRTPTSLSEVVPHFFEKGGLFEGMDAVSDPRDEEIDGA